MATLYIDPGAITGWSVFDKGSLREAGVCSEWPERGGVVFAAARYANLMVIECPHTKWRATIKDMIMLGRRIGRWEQWAKPLGIEVKLMGVNEWKGSVPKPIMEKRILAALTDAERTLLPKLAKTRRHNMIDAVGIGLHCERRLRR